MCIYINAHQTNDRYLCCSISYYKSFSFLLLLLFFLGFAFVFRFCCSLKSCFRFCFGYRKIGQKQMYICIFSILFLVFVHFNSHSKMSLKFPSVALHLVYFDLCSVFVFIYRGLLSAIFIYGKGFLLCIMFARIIRIYIYFPYICIYTFYVLFTLLNI